MDFENSQKLVYELRDGHFSSADEIFNCSSFPKWPQANRYAFDRQHDSTLASEFGKMRHKVFIIASVVIGYLCGSESHTSFAQHRATANESLARSARSVRRSLPQNRRHGLIFHGGSSHAIRFGVRFQLCTTSFVVHVAVGVDFGLDLRLGWVKRRSNCSGG